MLGEPDMISMLCMPMEKSQQLLQEPIQHTTLKHFRSADQGNAREQMVAWTGRPALCRPVVGPVAPLRPAGCFWVVHF